ncbi:MAG: DUF1295 domain-containing protein [Myxococcales bacterium]|nr:DUF1295 domain-containing protein [Myxococcales bacterium]
MLSSSPTAEVALLPWILATYLLLVVVTPLTRQRTRTGIWALVVRTSSSHVERFVRAWTVVLLLAIAVWTGLAALAPGQLGIWTAPALLTHAGLAAFAVALVVMALAQAQMGASWRIGIDDEQTALVTRGLYGRIRHPIYSGVLLALLGLLLVTPAPWTIALALFGYVLIAIQSRLEDDHMLAQHDTEFAQWAARTGRFIPGLGRLQAPEARTA